MRAGLSRDQSAGLVPTLESDAGAILTQSLAIIEWLDETNPNPPLLPEDPLRARQGAGVRAGDRLRHPPGAESEGAGAVARSSACPRSR